MNSSLYVLNNNLLSDYVFSKYFLPFSSLLLILLILISFFLGIRDRVEKKENKKWNRRQEWHRIIPMVD